MSNGDARIDLSREDLGILREHLSGEKHHDDALIVEWYNDKPHQIVLRLLAALNGVPFEEDAPVKLEEDWLEFTNMEGERTYINVANLREHPAIVKDSDVHGAIMRLELTGTFYYVTCSTAAKIVEALRKACADYEAAEVRREKWYRDHEARMKFGLNPTLDPWKDLTTMGWTAGQIAELLEGNESTHPKGNESTHPEGNESTG